jgi:hypothetical protein
VICRQRYRPNLLRITKRHEDLAVLLIVHCRPQKTELHKGSVLVLKEEAEETEELSQWGVEIADSVLFSKRVK